MLKFCPPHLLFYVKDLGTKAGAATGFIVRILESKKDDVGLLEHELSHVRDCYYFLFLPYMILLKFKWFLKWCEIRAYKVQLRYPPATSDPDRYRRLYASFLATRYNLNTSVEEAYRRLGQ